MFLVLRWCLGVWVWVVESSSESNSDMGPRPFPWHLGLPLTAREIDLEESLPRREGASTYSSADSSSSRSSSRSDGSWYVSLSSPSSSSPSGSMMNPPPSGTGKVENELVAVCEEGSRLQLRGGQHKCAVLRSIGKTLGEPIFGLGELFDICCRLSKISRKCVVCTTSISVYKYRRRATIPCS